MSFSGVNNMRYEGKSSQDLEKDLAFEWKNVVFEYKTAGCRTPLKRVNYPGGEFWGNRYLFLWQKGILKRKKSCSFVSFHTLSENKKYANFRFVR